MAKKETYKFPTPINAIASLIKQRRLQILVHSCIYYQLDSNIVSDEKFDEWAKELEKLMKENPGLYSDRFDYAFDSWDSSSGYNLPHRDPWVLGQAEYLLNNV